MMYPAPPITKERVILPPGTSCGSFTVDDELEYLSDQAIAAGKIPKSTKTRTTYEPVNKLVVAWLNLYEQSYITSCKSKLHSGNRRKQFIGRRRGEDFELRTYIREKHFTCLPPYVPAKSKALKNISGSSNANTNGGNRVKM